MLFESVTVAHTGGYGMWVDVGSYNNSVQSCLFTDLGAGGVRIGSSLGGVITDPALCVEGTVVNNSVIQVCVAAGTVYLCQAYCLECVLMISDCFDCLHLPSCGSMRVLYLISMHVYDLVLFQRVVPYSM